jgi:hypothetical protein
MAQERYDKEQYERDLRRTLQDAGIDKLPPPPPARATRSTRIDLRPGSPGQVMIAGVALVLLEWLGLAAFLGGLAGIVGVGLLVFGLVSWLLRPRRREMYWRGRRIDWDEGAGWQERFYSFFYRR